MSLLFLPTVLKDFIANCLQPGNLGKEKRCAGRATNVRAERLTAWSLKQGWAAFCRGPGSLLFNSTPTLTQVWFIGFNETPQPFFQVLWPAKKTLMRTILSWITSGCNHESSICVFVFFLERLQCRKKTNSKNKGVYFMAKARCWSKLHNLALRHFALLDILFFSHFNCLF